MINDGAMDDWQRHEMRKRNGELAADNGNLRKEIGKLHEMIRELRDENADLRQEILEQHMRHEAEMNRAGTETKER